MKSRSGLDRRAPSGKRSGSWRAEALAWLLLAYAALVPITASVHVPLGVRVAIYNVRPYWLIGIAAVATGAVLFGLVPGARERLLMNRRLLGWSLTFPFFYFVVAFAKGSLNVPVAGQYLLWSLLSFGVVPALMGSHDTLRRVAWAALVLAAFQLGVVVLSWRVLGEVGGQFRDRMSVGIANPNIFAQMPQVVLAAFGMWWAASKPRPGALWRLGWAAAISTAAVLAYLARSRNVLAFLVATGLGSVIVTLYASRRRVWAVLASIALLAGTGLVLLGSEREDLDAYSSGRIRMWRMAVESALAEEPLMTTLVGPSKLPSVDVGAYDDAASDKVFTKTHIDNAYLELVLEAGVPGLILFLAPYALVIRGALRGLSRAGGRSRMASWSLSCWTGIAVQCVFASILPSFNNIVAMFVLMFGVASALAGSEAMGAHASWSTAGAREGHDGARR